MYFADRDHEELVEKMLPLYKSIYRRDSNGCCLHVVIEDSNWESIGDPDDKEEYKHKDCRALAKILNEIWPDDRYEIEWDAKTKTLEFIPEGEECECCGRHHEQDPR